MTMPYNPPTGTLGVYLNQWVKVASGDRVYVFSGVSLSGSAVYTNTGYVVFKCKECSDNWHVGLENFHGNVNDPASETIPAVLFDWVKKHRHVCNKFNNGQSDPKKFSCGTCHWPYGAHEESWLANATSTFEAEKAKVQKKFEQIYKPLPMPCGGQYQIFDAQDKPIGVKWTMHLDPKKFPPQPTDRSMTLKQFKGRKFRDIELDVEETCESPDSSIKTTSNE